MPVLLAVMAFVKTFVGSIFRSTITATNSEEYFSVVFGKRIAVTVACTPWSVGAER